MSEFNYISWPQDYFWTPHQTKKNPIGAQKSKKKKVPKIKSKSNVKIEEKKTDKSFCTIWVDPETIWTWFQPSKIANFGPKIGPLNQMTLKARIERVIENICCLLYD